MPEITNAKTQTPNNQSNTPNLEIRISLAFGVLEPWDFQ
jgi:hypothetical protein